MTIKTSVLLIALFGVGLPTNLLKAQEQYLQERNVVAPKILNEGDSLLVKELYFQGIQQKSAGQLAAAERTFEKVVDLQSDNHAAHFELARIHLDRGNFEEAEKSALKATTLNPDNEWYWNTLLEVYKRTGKVNEIASVFNELIRIHPETDTNYYDKAYALYLNKQYDEALAVYDVISERFGRTDDLYVIRHQVFLAKGDTHAAVAELEALIATKPASSQGYILLADLYTRLDRAKEAVAHLADASKRFRDDPLILLAQSDAYLAIGKQKQAYEFLRQAFNSKALDIDAKAGVLYTSLGNKNHQIGEKEVASLADLLVEIYPREAKAHAVRGDVYAQLRQFEQARDAYLQALDINQYIEGIWQQLLQVELQLGRYADVETHGKTALSLFPNHALMLFFTGHGFLGGKHYKEARIYLEKALNAADEQNTALLTQLYSSLGDTYNALGLHAESDVAYEEAIASDSTNAYALNNYAYYLALRKAKLSRAAELSKKSNELEPASASYEDTYAWVLFQQGKYDEALIWIKKAITHSDPVSDTLLEHYGDILAKLGRIDTAVEQWTKAKALAASVGKNIDKLTEKINGRQYVE